MPAADNIYVKVRAFSPRFAQLVPAAGESREERRLGALTPAGDERNSDFSRQPESGRGEGARCVGYSREAAVPTVQQTSSGLRFHYPRRTVGVSGKAEREAVLDKPYSDMPSDMDRRVRCGRPEWTAVAGPDGLPTSRGIDALQYATLAGGSGASAVCRGYRNDYLDYQSYLQRAERVPEHLISEGCASENLVPAYNMALGREVRSARRANGLSEARAKPVSFIGGGSDGNELPRMVIQQEDIFFSRRRPQAVGVPRVGEASNTANAGEHHCIITHDKSIQSERDNCPPQLSKGAHLLAMERNNSGDRDRDTQGRHPISSAAFQLYGQPAAPLSTRGDGAAGFGQTHHQQYSIRHRYERGQPAVQDRVKDVYYGEVISGRGHVSGDEGRTMSRAENISRSTDMGVDAGRQHSTGPAHTYRSVPVHTERDTIAPTSTLNARPYDVQSSLGMVNPNNTSSIQLRSTFEGRYQRARGVLSTEPSGSSASMSFAPSPSGDVTHFHHYNEDRGIGRSSVNIGGSGGEGGGDYQATVPFPHIRRSLSETANSSLASSFGGVRNVTRRPAPQHRQRQTNQRPGFRFNDDATDVTAFNGGALNINLNESSTRFAASATTTTTASLSPPGHRSRKSFVTPSDLAINGEHNSSPDFAALTLSSNGNSTTSALGSPRAPMGLETIDYPSCRLQNSRSVQSIYGDLFPTTPRSSGSTSTSSLTSPSRSASLRSAGDGGLLDQRSDPEKVCRETCPAPDCPGKGDCVPGATADTVAYEVTFKRGKMTFLPGDGLGDDGISCGDRVKVEADRGEDLGTVHRSLLLSEYLDALYEEKKAKAAKIAQNGGGGGGDGGGGSEGKKKRNKVKKHHLAEDGDKYSSSKQHHHHHHQQKKHEEAREEACPVRAIKKILRPATEEELQQLEQKAQEEEQILHVCQTKVRNRGLPMKIVDAEYQFDRHKLTLFFEAERRVDFRELVRDLFAVYKTRIWMQQVKDKDKKSTSSSGTTAPDSDAPASIASGSSSSNSSNSNGDASGLGNPFLNVPSRLLIDDAVTTHDADHDSGYGSAISSDSGHPMVECLVSLAEGGDGNDTGGGAGAGALGFDSISEAFCGDSFKKSGSTACASSMSWLDEIESDDSVGGSGGISFRSKRPFAAQYPVLLQGIDFSF